MGSIGAAGWGSRHRWVSGEETETHFGLTFRFFPTPNQGKKEEKRIKIFSQVIKGKERRPPPHVYGMSSSSSSSFWRLGR